MRMYVALMFLVLIVAFLALAGCGRQDPPRSGSASEPDSWGSHQTVEAKREILVGSLREPDQLVVRALSKADMLSNPLANVVLYHVDAANGFVLVAVQTGSGVVRSRFVLLKADAEGNYMIHRQSKEYFIYGMTTTLTSSGSGRTLEIKAVSRDRSGKSQVLSEELRWKID